MKMSVPCHPQLVAVPLATILLAVSTVSAPLVSVSTRTLEAARMWMSVQSKATPAAMVVPTHLVASCVAVPKATSGLDKGKRFKRDGQECSGHIFHALIMNIGFLYPQNPLTKLHMPVHVGAYMHTQRSTSTASHSYASIHEYMSVSLVHFFVQACICSLPEDIYRLSMIQVSTHEETHMNPHTQK